MKKGLLSLRYWHKLKSRKRLCSELSLTYSVFLMKFFYPVTLSHIACVVFDIWLRQRPLHVHVMEASFNSEPLHSWLKRPPDLRGSGARERERTKTRDFVNYVKCNTICFKAIGCKISREERETVQTAIVWSFLFVRDRTGQIRYEKVLRMTGQRSFTSDCEQYKSN